MTDSDPSHLGVLAGSPATGTGMLGRLGWRTPRSGDPELGFSATASTVPRLNSSIQDSGCLASG